MKTFKEFMYEAHLMNTDPHDDFEIEKTSKMGPSQTTYKHKPTGIHVTATHAGTDQKGRPVHTVTWRHPESEGNKNLSAKERLRIGLHGVRVTRSLQDRFPRDSVVHASPTHDTEEKKGTKNRRGSIYTKMGMGKVGEDPDTGEHNQYGHITKTGKLKPLSAHKMEVTPESRPEPEEEPKRSKPAVSDAERRAHEREMRAAAAAERRAARGG